MLKDSMHNIFIEAPIIVHLLQSNKLFNWRILIYQLDYLRLCFMLFGEREQHAGSLQRITLKHRFHELMHIGIAQLVTIGLIRH